MKDGFHSLPQFTRAPQVSNGSVLGKVNWAARLGGLLPDASVAQANQNVAHELGSPGEHLGNLARSKFRSAELVYARATTLAGLESFARVRGTPACVTGQFRATSDTLLRHSCHGFWCPRALSRATRARVCQAYSARGRSSTLRIFQPSRDSGCPRGRGGLPGSRHQPRLPFKLQPQSREHGLTAIEHTDHGNMPMGSSFRSMCSAPRCIPRLDTTGRVRPDELIVETAIANLARSIAHALKGLSVPRVQASMVPRLVFEASHSMHG